jgi:hypothetical protein
MSAEELASQQGREWLKGALQKSVPRSLGLAAEGVQSFELSGCEISGNLLGKDKGFACLSSWSKASVTCAIGLAGGKMVSHQLRLRIKFAPAMDNYFRQLWFIVFAVHTTEARFYREFAAQAACRIPACYGAFASNYLPATCLLLEDVQGTSIEDKCDAEPPLSIVTEQLGRALDHLAQFHASFWREDPTALADFREFLPGAELYELVLKTVRDSQLPRGTQRKPFDRYVLPPERASHRDGPLMAVFEHCVRLNGLSPYTLTTGDFRRGNTLVEWQEPGIIRDICLIDFACARWGNPAFDVSLYMHLSIDPDLVDRRARIEFLERYYDRLMRCVTARTGKSPVEFHQDYAFEHFLDEFRCFALFHFILQSHPALMGSVPMDDDNIDFALNTGEFWGRRILRNVETDIIEAEATAKAFGIQSLTAYDVRNLALDSGDRLLIGVEEQRELLRKRRGVKG